MEDEKKRDYVTNKELQLEIKSLRTEALAAVDVLRRDAKIWLIGALAFNQFLQSVEVPPVVSGGLVGGIIVKGLIAWFAKS